MDILVKDYLKTISETYEANVKVSITHVDTISDVTLRSDIISMVAQLFIAPVALKSYKTVIEVSEDDIVNLEKISFKKGEADWFATISFVESEEEEQDVVIMVNVITTDEDLSVAALKEKVIKTVYKI